MKGRSERSEPVTGEGEGEGGQRQRVHLQHHVVRTCALPPAHGLTLYRREILRRFLLSGQENPPRSVLPYVGKASPSHDTLTPGKLELHISSKKVLGKYTTGFSQPLSSTQTTGENIFAASPRVPVQWPHFLKPSWGQCHPLPLGLFRDRGPRRPGGCEPAVSLP